MKAAQLVAGSQTPTCRLCSYLRQREVTAAVIDSSPSLVARWRLKQAQHVSTAHRRLGVGASN